MAKRKLYNQLPQNDPEKTADTDISTPPTAGKSALVKRKTEEKIELSNRTNKVTSVQRKASQPLATNRGARPVSRPNSSNMARRTENSTPVEMDVQTLDNGNNIVSNGSIFKKNTFSIVTLSLFCFLMVFVLFFCILPLKKISYEVPVAYEATETYIEQEPYTETVYYWEKEPYTVSEAYTVKEPYTITEPYFYYPPMPPPPPASGNVVAPPPLPPPPPLIQNRQIVRYMNVTKYKDVIRYEDVQKSRAELRYRPVQKQRTVTKVRQEARYKTVPLLYAWITY